MTIVDATAGTGDLIMGNILGSNALNVLLILGLSAVICKLPSEKTTRMIDMPFLVFVSALFLVFGIFVGPYSFGKTDAGETYLDATMPWYCGLILLLLYIGFMAYNIVLARKQSKAMLEQATAVSVADPCAGGEQNSACPEGVMDSADKPFHGKRNTARARTQRADTAYKQNICNVTADYVAGGNTHVALFSSGNRGYKLGKRRTERNYSERDYFGIYAYQVDRYGSRRVDHKRCAAYHH